MENNFDIVQIDSGTGGYIAAIRAAQLGYKSAIVEKYRTLGATCTNAGCIPTKALLDSTEHFYDAQTKFQAHGIETDNLRLNFSELMKRKNGVIEQNTSGLNYLMNKNKIEIIEGTVSFINNKEIVVPKAKSEDQKISATHLIIATGSKPVSLPNIIIDKKRTITSTEVLVLREQPKSISVIGGGVIGVEMASIYARIGTKVTIIEYADSIIPTMDKDLGKELKKLLTKKGIDILLNHNVQSVRNNRENTTIQFTDKNNTTSEITAEYCLVAVGRKPYSEGLSLENTSVKLDEKGRIITKKYLQTCEENIYTIGDVIRGPMLAHKAEEEGVFAVETINGQKPHMNYNLLPSVIHTWPEVASVGYTEDELKRENKSYRIGKFPFSASGRARATMESEGFVKVISKPKYGEILGIQIIGQRVAD